jgi:anthranilate/para-aminobenzoate synthase component II
MPEPFVATRYHSLIVEEASLPQDFVITARTAEREIMGLRHEPTGAEGVQFHPESILTESGERLLENFAHAEPA